MRFLLDTQIIIWFLEGNQGLPPRHYRLIQDSQNEVLLSHTSLFEIAIKLKIGKLTIDRGLEGLISDCKKEDIMLMPITSKHILAYHKIPFYEDHRDPFDRLILATALAENIPVLSADEKFLRYRELVEVIG
jgi:PIN domain nuclease of toxin-antitoxin system